WSSKTSSKPPSPTSRRKRSRPSARPSTSSRGPRESQADPPPGTAVGSAPRVIPGHRPDCFTMSESRFNSPRIVVTGMGAVTNLGLDARTTWEAMREGRSGISIVSGDSFAKFGDKWDVRIAGQIKDFDPSRCIEHREAKRLDRFSQLGLYASVEA